MSILGALTLRGPLQSMCINGATDGRVFLTFLREVLVPQLWPGAVVVMDNLGAHKVKGVRELIEGAGARLLYLPPYSADFNPIELAWSKLKPTCAPWPRAPARPWTAPLPTAWRPSAPRMRAATLPTAAT